MKLVTATVALVSLLAPTIAVADNRIVPGVRIGAVGLGDERAALETRTGVAPGVVVRTYPTEIPSLMGEIVRFSAAAITADFGTSEASTSTERFTTVATRYRTSRGIGVGSRLAALRRAYRRAACDADSCQLVRVTPTAVSVTRFALKGGRVKRVTLQRFLVSEVF